MKPLHILIFGIILAVGLFSGSWLCKNTSESNYKLIEASLNQQKAIQYVNACDYQLEFIEDSILVWDGRRYVGTIPMWDNSPLDSLLRKDND